MLFCALLCLRSVSFYIFVYFQIEQAGRSKVKDNLEKITADYVEIKKENAALIAKIKGKS